MLRLYTGATGKCLNPVNKSCLSYSCIKFIQGRLVYVYPYYLSLT